MNYSKNGLETAQRALGKSNHHLLPRPLSIWYWIYLYLKGFFYNNFSIGLNFFRLALNRKKKVKKKTK